MSGAPPFMVCALPRSGTFWLSQLFTIGGYSCAHEQVRFLRNIDDMRLWLSQSWTGAVETAGVHGWRVGRHLRPDLRLATIRRPIPEVVESLRLLGVAPDAALPLLRRLDRRLDHMERTAGGVLRVAYSDLHDDAAMSALFKHCTGFDIPVGWLSTMAPLWLECDFVGMTRYVMAHRRVLDRLGRLVVGETATIRRLRAWEGRSEPAGVTMQVESFENMWAATMELRTLHSAESGPRDGLEREVNATLLKEVDRLGASLYIVARAGDRTVGYCQAFMAPTLDVSNMMMASVNAFFVDRQFRGLGIPLARRMREELQARGVGEVFLRAGMLASGDRLGALWRRWGATDAGHMYRLALGG